MDLNLTCFIKFILLVRRFIILENGIRYFGLLWTMCINITFRDVNHITICTYEFHIKVV